MNEGQENDHLFSVLIEAEGYDKPLISTNMTFARLLDDIVVPYEKNETFFADGACVKRDNVRRIKIIMQNPSFLRVFNKMHYDMQHHSDYKIRKVIGDQYAARMEALLRERGDDVTSQVINAYEKTIKDRISEYVPKRDELIGLAKELFISGIKALGSTVV